jgi:putative ABC transport system permease protein
VTLGVTLATGVFFGVAPALTLSAGNLASTLKSASGRTTASQRSLYLRRTLVVMELALALVLLIGNGLMIRTFWRLLSVDAGFNPENVLTMRVALPAAAYPDSTSSIGFWSNLEERIRNLPGVAGVAMVGGLPPVRPINANDTQIEGFVRREGGPIQNIDYWQFVGIDYFNVMGIRLIDGRGFDGRDGAGSPAVAVINRRFAEIYWPGETAIGRRVRAGFDGPWFTIVGVVDDAKNAGVDRPAGTELYFAMPQFAGTPFTFRTAFLTVKTAGNPIALAAPIRAELRNLDPSLPVSAVRTMEDVIADSQARPRFLTLLLSLFSAAALVLAAVGIYGVISYAVAQRTNEFGIRMALGAQSRQVVAGVLGQGLILGVTGILIGVAAAVGLTRFLNELLFEVGALDPLTFGSMALLLLAVTFAACLAPAMRATRVDPAIALRDARLSHPGSSLYLL